MTEFRCYFIRHGKTAGNRARRYVGRTDEPLLPEERERLKNIVPPEVDRVLVSPMLRCMETAEILFPDLEREVVPAFREMDFGLAEYRTDEEMKGLPWYRRFYDGKEDGFPEGETKTDFNRRVRSGTEVLEGNDRPTALVIHGGTIMSLLYQWTGGKEGFYHWMPSNAKGWQGTVSWEEGRGFSIRDVRPFPEDEVDR